MEPAGLAVGVFAIAGLFNNAVNCFEYVQLGQNFEEDFTTCILKLDDAKLRLSRWGQAVGLNGDLRNTKELNQIFSSEEINKNVQKRLRHILKLFSDAEGISHKFQIKNESNRNALQPYDPQEDLIPEIRSLRAKLRDLSVKRENVTALKPRAKWALYEGKHFRQLIEDITSIISSLVDLFPSIDSAQRRLCDEEAVELVTPETRQILRDIAAEQDKLLEDAMAKMAKQQVRKLYTPIRHFAKDIILASHGQ